MIYDRGVLPIYTPPLWKLRASSIASCGMFTSSGGRAGTVMPAGLRAAAADEVLAGLTRAVLETVPATVAGLAAKAKWATGSELPDAAAVVRLRSVAEDAVALAERGGLAS